MNSASASYLADAPDSRPAHAADASGGSPAGWPIAILGVPFDRVTVSEAIGRIEAMIATRRPHYVVTADVGFLAQTRRDVELRRILLEADLVLCEGKPLVWASRWLGNALPERVASSDLAPELVRVAAVKGYRIFVLGPAPGVTADAEANLRRLHPTLNIVGSYAPPVTELLEMNHVEIARRVREAAPDILLVSFGSPLQEKWIAMNHRALGVPVAIGVGWSLGLLAGRGRRSPGWVRRAGLGWLHRFACDPARAIRRWAHDVGFLLPSLAMQWWRLAPTADVLAGPQEISFAMPDWCSVDAGARLTRRSLEQDAAFWRDIPLRAKHCLVNVSKIRRIDGTGVAFLIRWRKLLLTRGRQLVLLAPSVLLRHTLATLRLADHFVVANDVAQATQHAEALVNHASVQRDGTTRSLAWCGEIIAANVDDVWRMTTDHVLAFVANHATLIIIDLARLRFIDSSGANLMLRLKKWGQQLHTEILFAHAQPNIRNVLRLTGVDQLLLEGGQ